MRALTTRQELGRKMMASFAQDKPTSGQHRGGPVGEEARTGKRFPLELPIKIHKGETGDAKGVTGNLSAAGVFIRADAAMEIGSPVEFEITLPPEMTGGQENVTIQCKGRVVRSDPAGSGGEGRGVACVIDSYEFVRNS
jgi:PilZ domain